MTTDETRSILIGLLIVPAAVILWSWLTGTPLPINL